VAVVWLRRSQSASRTVTVEMRLGTDGGVTLLPRASVERIGGSPLSDRQYELMGFGGGRSLASVVFLDMGSMGETFRGQYLVTGAPRGISGRDVLDHLALTFHGPGLEWSLSTT
jgi:hypothetical protein